MEEEEEKEERDSVVKVNPTYLETGVVPVEQEEEEGDTTSCDISGTERATTSGLMWDNFDVGDGSSVSTGILTEGILQNTCLHLYPIQHPYTVYLRHSVFSGYI